MAAATRSPWILLSLLVVSLSTAQDIKQLSYHLQQLTDVRHPAPQHAAARGAARAYVKEQFRQYGLELATHPFNTSVLLQGKPTTVRGENVVGVAKGEGKGPLVLVGAHYDSSPQYHPLEDNGAGVAAMLEVARNYMATTGPGGAFVRASTVLFVAFDLNTKEYRNGGGSPGSFHFLHQWLWPFLNNTELGFGGAFILDSVSKFNNEPNSQYLPPTFNATFPAAYSKIHEERMKGNFLAVVARGTSQSRRLIRSFTGNYNKDRKASVVRVQEMVLENGAPFSADTFAMIDHQAPYQFWSFQPSEQQTPLPALLLTDTDVRRKPAEGDACPVPCSSQDFLTPRRQEALSSISGGLLRTLHDLQAERVATNGGDGEENGGSGAASSVAGSSLAATLLMAGVARLLR